jgi:hypothetical protein
MQSASFSASSNPWRISYAKSYGTVGQEQQGMDVYGRLRLPPTQQDEHDEHEDQHAEQEQERVATASPLPPRRYASLQSKRVKVVKPSALVGGAPPCRRLPRRA